jgi:aldehyde dehydrogenase (NAD+)
LISSTLELSGCDAMIVMHNADLDLAAKAAYFGFTLNKGQTCLAVRRIFVQQDRYREFLERLGALHKNHHPEVLALFGQAEQAERLVNEAMSKGAKLLNRSSPPKGENDPPRFPITVLFDATPEMGICQEAAFAPIACVQPFDTIPDVIEKHQRCGYGLGVSIFTAYPEMAAQIAHQLEVGVVTINDVLVPTAHPATPFAGRKLSGWGVTQGAEGLLAMTVPQVVTIRKGDFRPHYDSGNGQDEGSQQMVAGMLNYSHGKGLRATWRGIREMIRGGWKNWRKRPE